MDFLSLFKKKQLTKEQVAQLLNTSTEALAKFEEAYQNVSDEANKQSGNFFKLNSRDVSQNTIIDDKYINEITNRIVSELTVDRKLIGNAVTKDEVEVIDKALRPQLTGTMYCKDIGADSSNMLLFEYSKWLETGDIHWYHMFRQGLDLLDLDPITYKILGMNPASMGFWFPALKYAVDKQSFFKVPETKIVRVPLPILQLTHMDYFQLNPTTLKIVDEWAKKVFELDENKTYFIKTGTYSSKFDFRNAKVTSPTEVNEIGQYLLFIHHQALCMSHYDLSGKNQPIIYGVSTTNEWVVREYIEDKENLPCIYHGMPLHTEYRLFVDFDTKEVLGNVMYWDSETMKKRFSQCDDSDSADMKHDYIIYCKEERRLTETFTNNKDNVTKHIEMLLKDINLTGQWSIDVMQNGDEFWIIDMAPAYMSALSNKLSIQLNKPAENWLPDLSKGD